MTEGWNGDDYLRLFSVDEARFAVTRLATLWSAKRRLRSAADSRFVSRSPRLLSRLDLQITTGTTHHLAMDRQGVQGAMFASTSSRTRGWQEPEGKTETPAGLSQARFPSAPRTSRSNC